MRGVHLPLAPIHNSNPGSSPHARGPPGKGGKSKSVSRIIPACAGSTRDTTPRICAPWDHPRMRGVHILAKRRFNQAMGSSPHARGPRSQLPTSTVSPGIIPACAGSTHGNQTVDGDGQDHPRMRGVHPFSSSTISSALGSSPHARGPLASPIDLESILGIIPACAGSTFSPCQLDGNDLDHPRMRGVHVFRRVSAWTIRGSSPHARGPRFKDSWYNQLRRIIPACAGSTNSQQVLRPSNWDHPRMRGVHTVRIVPAN